MVARRCILLILAVLLPLASSQTVPTILVSTSNPFSDSLARAEDAITVTFDAGTTVIPSAPQCSFPTLSRTPQITSDFGGRRWYCIVTVAAGDSDGLLEYTVSSAGSGDVLAPAAASGTSAVATVSRARIAVDNAGPVPGSVSVLSSGARALTVNVGERATLTYVASEDVRSFAVDFEGIAAERVVVAGSGQVWQAVFTARAGDPVGAIAFVATAVDLAGNSHVARSPAAAGNAEISAAVDADAPRVEAVTLESSNAFNASYAVEGSVVTLRMRFREAVRAPEITVLSSASGTAKMAVTGLVDTYEATYTVARADRQGPFSFLMEYRDEAGNVGAPVNQVTAGTAPIIDTLRPAISAVAEASSSSSSSSSSKILSDGGILSVLPSVSEPVLSLTVTVRGLSTAPEVAGSGSRWTARARAAAADSEGEVTYAIDATDFAGNSAIRYQGVGPIRPICGSGIAVAGEVCDGDSRCTATCTCAAPFYADATGARCVAAPMIAVVDHPDAARYSLELWENAHSPPAGTFPVISDWAAEPNSTGPVRAATVSLEVSAAGWTACAVKPEIGKVPVNVSFVSVAGPEARDPSRVAVPARPTSLSSRITAAATFSTSADARTAWARVLAAAAAYSWAEPDGFSVNGTRAVASRFPNSTSSATRPEVDANTFARHTLRAAGIAWPAVAPIGTTARGARISPRNRIDFYCGSVPFVDPSTSCAAVVGSNNANASVQSDPCTVIVPLVTVELAQVSPPLTGTAFAAELELATGVLRDRISVFNLETRARGTRQRAADPPLVRSRGRRGASQRQGSLPSEDPAADTVVVEFLVSETDDDPLGLGAIATITAAVDAVDQTPLLRRRLFVRGYNIEDLTRRPPVPSPEGPSDPTSASNSGTARAVWIALVVVFSILAIVLIVWMVRRRKRQVTMAEQAEIEDKVLDAQRNEFPWEAPQKGDAKDASGLPVIGNTRRKLDSAKGKLADLPMLSFSQKVALRERESRGSQNGTSEDDLEFTSQSVGSRNGNTHRGGSLNNTDRSVPPLGGSHATTPPPPLQGSTPR